jgi:hypothetical protein
MKPVPLEPTHEFGNSAVRVKTLIVSRRCAHDLHSTFNSTREESAQVLPNGAAPDNILAIRDLLADLKHYCDANAINFFAELDSAHRHYTEEVVEARQDQKRRTC